jgi:hypothetical protein
MEFIITENQKIIARETARRRLETELFTAALLAGVDPNELELVDGSFTWQPNYSNHGYSDPAQRHLQDILDVYQKFLSQN